MNCRTAFVRRPVIWGVLSVVFLAGCGGGASPAGNNPSPDPPRAIAVNISPQTASVQVGNSTQFTATVQNDPKINGVTWSVVPSLGIYQVSANGRGTAAFSFTGQDPGFSQFSFYVVSGRELLFIETDTCDSGSCTFKGGISGEAWQQSGGPFTAGSLNGPAAFNLTAAGTGTATGGSVAVGQEIFDGRSNVTGIKDENS